MIIGSSAFEVQRRAAEARFAARGKVRDAKIRQIAKGDWLRVDDPVRVRAWLARRGVVGAEAERLLAEGSGPVSLTESLGVAEPQALERVLGSSDLMGVAFLELGLQVSHTVGRIWVDVTGGQPRGYGTGFMVSPSLLLTNHHVLESAVAASTSAVQFNYQLGPGGQPCPPAYFRLAPDRFFITSQPLDYALVAVAPNAEQGGRKLSEFGFNSVFPEEGKAIEAQWVNIIQHPDGGYKQLALRENQLVDIFDAFLTYNTDTAPGSSGSPIFNDRWEVVGLHHSGVMAKDKKGRVLAADGKVWTPQMGEDRVKWVSNEGIRISRIVKDLEAQAITSAQKALVQEMLRLAGSGTLPAPPPAPAVAPPSIGGNETFRGDGVVGSDGTASWVIPLRVTVQVGDASAGAASAPVCAPQPTAAIPASGASPGESIDAAVEHARTTLGARQDVLGVRRGYVFRDGWITREPALVVVVRQRLTPAALREAHVEPLPRTIAGFPVEVVNPSIEELLALSAGVTPQEALTAGGLLGEEIVYKPPPGTPLTTVTATMEVTAAVSPDRGWPFLKAFLAGAKNTLVVAMYDFGATHIAAAIEAAAAKPAFKKLTLALQKSGSVSAGSKDIVDQAMADRLKATLGGKFELSWIFVDFTKGWVAHDYHIKVAVRDKTAFWLSSGNWRSSNLPDADPFAENPQKRSWLTKNNRDWHLIVDHAGLAKTFETYIRNDFTSNLPGHLPHEALTADVLLPGVVLAPSAEEAAKPFAYFDTFKANRAFTVTPLLTPDNYLAGLLELIDSAEEELFIQNQTFNAPRPSQDQDLRKVINAVLRRQNAGVDVRIIFRDMGDAAGIRKNVEALQDLGLDPKRIKVQVACHTKGIMVDGKRVLVGSQNISQLGVTLNRDASLLFDDAPLTDYFRKVFLHDWANLARQTIGSEHHAPELIDASAPTPPGMERMSLKDYLETA